MNKSKPELSWNHTYVYRNPNMIWEMILRQCLRGWSMAVFSAAAAAPLNLEVADLWEIVCQAQY